MSKHILQRINSFVSFGGKPLFADWEDLAECSLMAMGVLALAWPLLAMALL